MTFSTDNLPTPNQLGEATGYIAGLYRTQGEKSIKRDHLGRDVVHHLWD